MRRVPPRSLPRRDGGVGAAHVDGGGGLEAAAVAAAEAEARSKAESAAADAAARAAADRAAAEAAAAVAEAAAETAAAVRAEATEKRFAPVLAMARAVAARARAWRSGGS